MEFEGCNVPVPYWLNFESLEERKKAIDSYHLQKQLNQELTNYKTTCKKMKI